MTNTANVAPQDGREDRYGTEGYDENLIDAADRLLRAALRGHTFRLAVQCDTCGTWLTSPVSVRRHRGPVCAKREQGKAGAA